MLIWIVVGAVVVVGLWWLSDLRDWVEEIFGRGSERVKKRRK